jgi:hypothetical protein
MRDSGEASPNGWRAQQADALLAIAKASLAGELAGDASFAGAGAGAGAGGEPAASAQAVSRSGALSKSVADHSQVVVHVDDSALRGGRGRSELPIDTVRRLTCDCSVVTIVEDERGTPLDVGRKRRTCPRR